MTLLSRLSKMISCNSELLFLTSSYFDWKFSSDSQNAWVPTKFFVCLKVRKCRRSTSRLNLSLTNYLSHKSSFIISSKLRQQHQIFTNYDHLAFVTSVMYTPPSMPPVKFHINQVSTVPISKSVKSLWHNFNRINQTIDVSMKF